MSELTKVIKQELEANIKDVETMCTSGVEPENEIERYVALIVGLERLDHKARLLDDIVHWFYHSRDDDEILETVYKAAHILKKEYGEFGERLEEEE